MRMGRRAGRAAAVVAGIGIAAAAGLAVGIGAAGGAGPAREHTTDEFRGLTLFEVYSRVNPGDPLLRPPMNFGYITHHLDGTVTPHHSDLDLFGHESDWTVVASCYLDDDIPGDPATPAVVLGVVPRADVTPQIRELARARAYDHFVGECPGTRVTFTAPPPADPPA